MNKLLKTLVMIACVKLISGCAITEMFTDMTSTDTVEEEPEWVAPLAVTETPGSQTVVVRDYTGYAPRYHNKSLNDYARQMVMDFDAQRNVQGSIAVVSFVDFDNTLRRTNRLGNQLAEALVVEMSSSGYNVSEVNAVGEVVINSDGNFVFSRKRKLYDGDLCCVLSGNIIYEGKGVRINSKLFELSSKRIVAASSVVIPYFVVENLG